MSGRTASRRGGRRHALILALVVVLVALAGPVAVLGPASAAGRQVLLTPSAAEAGQPVQAVVSGFDECVGPTPTPAPEPAPQPAPGPVERVVPGAWTADLTTPVTPPPGTVQLTWDDGRVAEPGVRLIGGQATADLTVPDDLAPGSHVLVAECVEIPVKLRTESPTFTVLEPTRPTDPTTPPTPLTPTPTEVTPTTLPPTDVPVPDLRGKTATEAEAALVDVGLRLGRVDSTRVADGVGVVDQQDPPAGTRAAPGQAVDVTLAAVAPLVSVPDVVGLTAREADRVLDAAGLQPPPVDAADLDARVTGQSPDAGSAVPAATTVDLSLSSATAATAATSWPWRATAVVLAGLAAAGLLGRHLLRGRHDRRWVAEHVDVRPSAGFRHPETATHRTSSEPDLAVGLRGHRDDHGTQTLEEVHR